MHINGMRHIRQRHFLAGIDRNLERPEKYASSVRIHNTRVFSSLLIPAKL